MFEEKFLSNFVPNNITPESIPVGDIDNFKLINKKFSQIRGSYDNLENLLLFWKYSTSKTKKLKDKSTWKNLITRDTITKDLKIYLENLYNKFATQDYIIGDDFEAREHTGMKSLLSDYIKLRSNNVTISVDHIISTRLMIKFINSYSVGKREESKPSFLISNLQSLKKHLNNLWNLRIISTELNRVKGIHEGLVCNYIKNNDFDSIKNNRGCLQLFYEINDHLKINNDKLHMFTLFRNALNYVFKQLNLAEIKWVDKSNKRKRDNNAESESICLKSDCPCQALCYRTKNYFNNFYNFIIPEKIYKINENSYYCFKKVDQFENYTAIILYELNPNSKTNMIKILKCGGILTNKINNDNKEIVFIENDNLKYEINIDVNKNNESEDDDDDIIKEENM